MRSFADGRVAVVQSDSRMCDPPANASASDRYWWLTVQINARWAEAHGYDHMTYCIRSCVRAPRVRMSPAWCKLLVLQDLLNWNRWDNLLYLDSDAFWNQPSTGVVALDAFIGPDDTPSTASVLFGCNLPYASEDYGRRRWNRSWVNGERGPANTGVMVIRNSSSARQALSAWWNATYFMPWWNTKFGWEQSALWELWKRPSFAAPLRVLSNLSAYGPPDKLGTRYDGDCMRTMDRSRPSLITHLPSGGTSSGRGGHASQFDAALEESWQLSTLPPKGWRTWFVELNGTDETVSRCARRLRVGSYSVHWHDSACASGMEALAHLTGRTSNTSHGSASSKLDL